MPNEILNKNKYTYRNAGFAISIVILIVVNILTYLTPDLTDNQTKIYVNTVDICMYYMLGYLCNNAIDFHSKVQSIKKTNQ